MNSLPETTASLTEGRGDDVEHIVSFAPYKMLTKALYYATEIFLKRYITRLKQY